MLNAATKGINPIEAVIAKTQKLEQIRFNVGHSLLP